MTAHDDSDAAGDDRTDGPTSEPTRDDVDALTGPVVVEFGAAWCGYCRAIQPKLKAALADHPDVQHLKIEDGKGRRLGRSFGVKLWPTFVFMKDGAVVDQVARPEIAEVRAGLEKITT